MRNRWWILVMVALLVMRGWVGEAIAGQMLAQQLRAPGAEQAVEIAHGADCHGQQATDNAGNTTPKSCDNCQDCSLNALPAAPVSLALALPQAPRAHAAVRFASAEPRAGSEPPVS